MKYLKLFEIVKKPQVGDYVYCEDIVNRDPESSEYLETHIGRVVDIDLGFSKKNSFAYFVEFKDIDNFDIHNKVCLQYRYLPTELAIKIPKNKQLDDCSNIARVNRKKIIYFSSDITDIETYINAKKYNL